MKNLQHIARVSPLQVSNYAKHQREKLPKDKDKNIKASHQGIASVWQAVIDCCQLTKNSDTGSLEKEGRKYWDTTWLVLDSPLPQGAKIEDRQHRKQLSGARKEFQERWLSETVPVFFDFFCIEYVFQITHSSVQEI